jgi:hypothetical protein
MSDFDSIILAGQSLRPAPYVSTSYEYNKFNGYIVGGFLIVTLSGTLVDENIIDKISDLNSLQASQDCVSLTIGCGASGGKDFLDGNGRIRSVDINQTDQPYVANYTIVIAIETIGGQPSVTPDPDFATYLGLGTGQIPNFLQSYDENISIDGNAEIISSHDTGMSISKSYIKASGSINMKVYTNYICGLPSNNPLQTIESFLQLRSGAIINGLGSSNPLGLYSGWTKFLDTKSLEIKMDGNITWSFDLYMSSSGGAPLAFVDATTTDRKDQKTKVRNRSISGSIKGLSLATIGDHIGHKADSNERIANAQNAFNFLDGYLRNGIWPGTNQEIAGQEGTQCLEPVCPQFIPPICYQRISHTVNKSVVSGEISFNMEFADINACKPQDFGIDITIDENFPAAVHQEIIVPNRQIKPGQLYPRSIIQIIGDSTRSVTITVRASLNGCDKSKLQALVDCARAKLATIINTYYPSFGNWVYRRETETTGSFSYTIVHERFKCDFIN